MLRLLWVWLRNTPKILVDTSRQTQIMDHTVLKRIIAGGDALEFYVLTSPHILTRQLNVKFRPSSNGEYFDMSYNAIEKPNTHVRQPEVSFNISKERYLVLMRSIGDKQNVESTCLQYLWPSDELDSVFPGLFLSCIEGFTKLCQALCTNRTMSTLQIQLSGKAPAVLALSQAFDTNVSSPSQLLTIDPAEKQMMEVTIAMKVAIKEIAFLLCHNKALQTIQIQSDNNSDQDWVKLVRPLTKDLYVHQRSNVGLANLHVTISGSAMPAAVYNLAFHEVFQSSTLKELTVETLDHYGDVLDSSHSCELLQALVRALIVDEAGQEAKANLNKLTLVLPHFRVNGSWSRAIFAEILPELLQRNSTLKELTVKAPQFYEEREETREEKLCALSLEFAELCRALCTNSTMSTLQIQLSDKAPYEGFQDQVTLVRPLTTDSDGQQANVDLAKLNVTISGSRMCGAECDLVFHEVLQSSTLKELTVETSDNYGHMLDSSRSCALLQALVRPLIADEAGQEAKANLSKLTLVLPHVRVNRNWSRAIFAEILPELLQRNSTLKELTVKAPQFYELREEMREEKLCALIQSLKDNKSLEILDLSECQGILTQRVIPTLMDILLVNFTLRDINFGDSSIWYGVKEQLRKNEKYMQSCLRKLPVAKAQAARVFLCGGPYAGMCHGIGVILHMLCHT